MSLIDKIENIQKKPEHIKRRILFVSVSLIMFVIIAIWATTFKMTTSGDKSPEGSIASPLAVFGGILSEGYNAGAEGLKKVLNGFSKDYGEGK